MEPGEAGREDIHSSRHVVYLLYKHCLSLSRYGHHMDVLRCAVVLHVPCCRTIRSKRSDKAGKASGRPNVKCSDCKIDYPSDLVQPFIYYDSVVDVCGICALARKNALHGTHFTEFTGEMAEYLRLEAVRYRGAKEGRT